MVMDRSGVRSKVVVVVLAEGDALLRRLHRRALFDSGVLVEEAESAEDALALTRKGRASLLVLDRHLPDADGWDVARALKASPDTRDVIVLGLAWHRERSDVDGALVAGCDAFLEKAATPEALVRHVRGLLDLPLDDAPAALLGGARG
ncbi:MAG: hypothetical protein JWP97_92 [Labilithrix sp.]|nr:hypothetical protein [Labilithrix sp.]